MSDAGALSNIPAELRNLHQWVCWRLEPVDGRLTKVPYQPTGRKASTTDPQTWSSFDECRAALHSETFSGIGFVFADNFTGIDLDHHRDPKTGELDPFAKRHVDQLNSYSEVSHSGSGVHIIARGVLPSEKGRRDAKQRVEMYSSARFFVMTGQHLDGMPRTVEPRQAQISAMFGEIFPAKKRAARQPAASQPLSLSDAELIAKANAAKNGATFASLWRGDWESGGYGSQSEADAALLGMLYFWTGGDKARSFSLFEQSGLNRDKWQREDYRESTWQLVAHGETYSPKSNGPDAKRKDARGRKKNSDESEESDEPRRSSAATRLVKLADEFAFFHDLQNRAFVRLDVNGHGEIWPVSSIQFRNLLAQTFYARTRTAINRNALADAISTLTGRACFEGCEEPVFMRVAPHGENILIDLCDPRWRVIEVTPHGWRIMDHSLVAFTRTNSMRPLPVPAHASEGSIEPLWELLNVTRAQRPLIAGALVNGFHPHGPYFVPNYVGEQGSAKSCAAKIHRQLIDPNAIPLRSPPREERDLLVHAANNWCVVLDNLSGLPPWLSDGICRLATGGGHSARQLYSDGEEFSLTVKRPVILNGIEDIATRPDLAERALQIELETIPDDRRISEKELWRRFEQVRPVIFSGLLNALVCALRELPNVKLDSLPRMADAALFATAAETAFGWGRGTFITAYKSNLNEGAVASVDAHPVGVAIRQLLDGEPEWSGEPAQLLKALNTSATDELKRARSWPQNPRTLSSCLRRLAQALRRAGIEVDFGKEAGRRQIRLCRRNNSASCASNDGPSDAQDAQDAQDANTQSPHDDTITVAPEALLL